VTPIQVFNRATDPFLPSVVPNTMAVLEDLDARGLTNHVLVITRQRVTAEHCLRLNQLNSIKLTLLFTYSGIDDRRIEPFPSEVAAASLRRATEHAQRYRTVLYWRPIVPGLNDRPDQLETAVTLSRHAHATVFTGLFYRDEIAAYYKSAGLPEPYSGTARRKIVPEELEARILGAFAVGGHAVGGSGRGGVLFRKTSCAVAYAHGVADYNGHFGIPELCDICPSAQFDRCASAHSRPTHEQIAAVAARLPEAGALSVLDIDDHAVTVAGLPAEQPRYYLQHALGFQVHDVAHPHRHRRHGRADIGWTASS
jgi:hypothetical protein